MGNQLQRFQERAFRIDDLEEIELMVPPGFGGSALDEFADGETGDWAALKRQKVNKILDSIPENRDPLTHLQEKEEALSKEIDEAEAEREKRIAELEDKLRRSIRHRFPDASERERDHFFRWVRDGRESLHRMSMDLLESGQITDPDNTVTPPQLWKETEEKERWRNRTEEFRRVEAAVRPLKFRLGMVQIVKRFARVGALDKIRESLQERGISQAKRRKLRGIAEEYTDELKDVCDYLDRCPEQGWPENRKRLFESVFPEEKPRNVHQRFHNWWERDRDLDFPGTVERLYQECKTALRLRDEFPVEST